MKASTFIAFALGLLLYMPAHGQNITDTSEAGLYRNMYHLIRHKNFFGANISYNHYQQKLADEHRMVIAAHLNNAFNKIAASDLNINEALQRYKTSLPDSIVIGLYALQHQNAYKQYDYAGAKNALEKILKIYGKKLTREEKDDYNNSLKLWRALAGQPKQEIKITGDVSIKMTKDIAGLNNLKMTNGNDSANFIFDTGANISTTVKSIAKKFKMTMLPGSIGVGTVTGKTVKAGLALCNYLNMNGIVLHNVVFLVLDDKDLAFPEANFQIYGIIGFPVIEALNEVQITRDGYFIVPQKETSWPGATNLALDNLTPIIELDEKHYTFDTGADQTILYKNYFDAYKNHIEAGFEKTTISYGGAGGSLSYEGYTIPFAVRVNGDSLLLEKTSVLSQDVKNKEIYVYGNIGQDFIRRFDKMTLNFNQMFLKFD